MNILVTAGPTREMIDDVRFLSNLSSGRTGFAVAAAARDRGHRVNLVHGPVSLSPPPGITVHAVTSALQMHDAVLRLFDDTDAVIMTAAVADYRPADVVSGKMKKKEGPLRLDMVRNPDILAELGQKKSRRVLVGFALEVQDAEANAMSKLTRKNLDFLVLNGPSNFGSRGSAFRLVTATGIGSPLELDKSDLGDLLVRRVEELHAGR